VFIVAINILSIQFVNHIFAISKLIWGIIVSIIVMRTMQGSELISEDHIAI